MGNKLFQQANEAVQLAEAATNSSSENASKQIDIAKNNLSSAFANSTTAEKVQLHELQNRLEACEQKVK